MKLLFRHNHFLNYPSYVYLNGLAEQAEDALEGQADSLYGHIEGRMKKLKEIDSSVVFSSDIQELWTQASALKANGNIGEEITALEKIVECLDRDFPLDSSEENRQFTLLVKSRVGALYGGTLEDRDTDK